MGRAYAGILGLLAFALLAARGVTAGAGVEGTLLAASGGMFAFAAFGYLAGQTADFLIRDSVRTQFQAAMVAFESRNRNDKTQPKLTT
jgi:hypothetical protein